MEINITLSQIWNNTSLRDYFMRSQAQRELEKLLEHVEDEADALETLDTNIYDYYGGDFDTFEEELYSGDYREIAENAGIELTEDEEEDEEEEEDWLDHAHEVLDENFPEEDELVKDDFCCEHWQNGLSDEDNIANFKEYVKSIAED